MKRGKKGKRSKGWKRNPGKTMLYVVAGIVGGYLLYNWYQKRQAAAGV